MKIRINSRITKRFLGVFLTLAMLISMGGIPVQAAGTGYEAAVATPQDADSSYPIPERTGLAEIESIPVTDEEAEELKLASDIGIDSMTLYASQDEYGIYASDYIYSRMTADEQDYYDALYEVCNAYLYGTEDCEYTQHEDETIYYIAGVSYEGLSYETARAVLFTFIYQNPQFYFLGSAYRYSTYYSTVWLVVYGDFADGDVRAEITENFFAKVGGWLGVINLQTTEYAREKKAHDIICENVVYGSTDYDQSAYSAVMEGKTVCAGYTKLFTMLCSGAGLEAISIIGKTGTGTSSGGHAWNMVKINGKWYNVDVTWDDGDPGIYYHHFNVAEEPFASTHVPDPEYADWRPAASDTDYDAPDDTNDVIEVEYIYINQMTAKLVLNETKNVQLQATVIPANATDTGITWTSSNESVATVSQSGNVTAKGQGQAVITATSNSKGYQAHVTVDVYKRYSAPQAPTVARVTQTSVTLNDISGCSYSMDGKKWQKSTTFNNLKPNTSYTFYARKEASGYYLVSDAGNGTTVKTSNTGITVSANGIYMPNHTNTLIQLGLVTEVSGATDLEYRWMACDATNSPDKWVEIQGWTLNNEWLNWYPGASGDYVIVCQVRVVGNEDCVAEAAIGVQHHEHIKGKCQMPYTGEGGGYLIGVETYDNPNQSYRYELLVADCTLLAQGKDAWIWTTGQCLVPETSLWAVWQPQYGYYWTLFRVYDADGNLIDEACFPFENIC